MHFNKLIFDLWKKKTCHRKISHSVQCTNACTNSRKRENKYGLWTGSQRTFAVGTLTYSILITLTSCFIQVAIFTVNLIKHFFVNWNVMVIIKIKLKNSFEDLHLYTIRIHSMRALKFSTKLYCECVCVCAPHIMKI